MNAERWCMLAFVALCSLLEVALGHSHVCPSTQVKGCSSGWKSFADRRYIYCPAPSGDQALIYAKCDTCVESSESLLKEVATTEGNITFDLSLCTQGDKLDNIGSGFGLHTYCVMFLDDVIEGMLDSNVEELIAELNMLSEAPNITLMDDSQEGCEIVRYPYVVPETLGLDFYNASEYDVFLTITDNDPETCIRSANTTVAICKDGIDPMTKARNMLPAQPFAVLRYECNDCGLNRTTDFVSGTTMPRFERILRRASYAADGGPQNAIFYNRLSCQSVFNVSNDINLYCRTVEYCENCVSYVNIMGGGGPINADDVYIRRGNKYFDRSQCFKVHDTYTNSDGFVFANVTIPEFNKTSSGLYCDVFYDTARREGKAGVPLLNYGERSSTTPSGEDSGASVLTLSALGSLLLSVLAVMAIN
eukprot:scpid71415/ scgid7551/ 